VRCIKPSIALGILLGLAIAASGQWASADGMPVTCTRTRSCTVTAERPAEGETDSAAHPKPNARQNRDRRNADESQRVLEARKKFSAAFAEYDRQLASYNRCVLIFDPSVNNAGCGNAPTPPNTPEFRSGTFSGGGNQPIRITAGQAAAIAVARLQLPKIPPGIGPAPDINPWNMAAVGYPLWLWADGPTHVGPISDSVAGLSVSLEAEVSGLSFRMGDGHTVTCAGSGHPWTTAVQPGTKSPSCGYTYAEPSLPDSAYTVAAIANWAVTWTSNGQSGVINVPAVDTTELPVGELQVLVR
jgi:hypothetical protein